MHILTAHYGRHRGGSERALERLIAAWRVLGHEVRCIVEPRAGAAALANALQQEAAAFPPDILFAGGQTYAPPFALLRRDRGMRRLPFAMKLSNAPLHPGRALATRASQAWLRLQARWTGRFVAPDDASARLLRAIGIAEAQIAVIANPAADESHLRRLHEQGSRRTDGEALRLLTMGRLASQKNIALMIEAFARIARPGDRLTVVGDGPLRAALEARTARHAADIRFPGHIDDPAPQFAEANGFALASDFEGLPAVLVEALAAGLPIAATASAPGLADLLGPHATLVPVRDAAALARALDGLRHASPDRGAMLERALPFTAERSAPEYIALFERMIVR